MFQPKTMLRMALVQLESGNIIGRRKQIMSKRINEVIKRLAVSVLAVVMVVSGIVIMPETAQAETATADTVVYEDRTSDFKTKWKADGSGSAPSKAGYVFGGWYTENETDGYTALNVETATAKLAEESLTEGVIAKFVPSYVLSVKAQINEGVTKGDGEVASIRIISAVDSKSYQKVGFEVLLNNKIPLYQDENNTPLETTRVYGGGLQVGSDATDVRTPQELFGQAANYISVWRLDDIIDENDTKIIYVRPYWITKDGTKVEGLPKYVHIEDGYNGYISIPINLRTAELVAAGQLEMSYDSDKIEIAKDGAGNMLVENGKMFDEMAFNSDVAGSIKFVGNTSGATDVAADDIYVNVRFKKTAESTYEGAGKGVFLTFKVSGEKFCNAEELIQKTVDAWDIKY